MTTTRVLVDLDGAPTAAGTLHSHRKGRSESATFTYDSSYLANPRAYQLDPELPLSASPSQTANGRSLFGAFTDTAPDRWGRTLLTRQEMAAARSEHRTARSLGDIDFMLGVRDDLRQGAVRFAAPDGTFSAPADRGVPALTDLPALLDLAERAESDTSNLDDLSRLVRVGSSLGGARPKAHVRQLNGSLAIAKFPSADRDTWDVMTWEKVALDLAAAAGIVVAPSMLLTLADRHVLVVDRFDRRADGARIGYVSAMTMLEATDSDPRSYLEIGEAIEEHTAQPTAELHQLWRRLLFGILIRNTDDHLRNHGFLHVRDSVWTLSPAFDVNPNPAPGPLYLSTSIDGADEPASVAAAVAVAPLFRLRPEQALAALCEVVAAVRTWPTVAARLGLSAAAQRDMAPAFAALPEADDLTRGLA
jgi:serine/threonine-protein kinase HipA